jgi:2,4-dienoyl-CoA reductase-like NADH-dependent reductase (Old Yellow Enzyme family)/nucleotide-binding universal stress UspA family protein
MLFEPFQLGPHTLKNRLIALPVFTGYALPDGHVSDLLMEHYRSLAESGVAMVTVANAAVAQDGVASGYNLRADRNDFIPGLARLARAIKKRGALACLQLNHAGRFARTDRPLLPSAMDSAHLAFHVSSLKEFMNFFPLERRFGLTQNLLQRLATWNRAMTEADGERIIASFGEAAARAWEAGFDMVELHGATGYLLSQFLSAFTHKTNSPADRANDFEKRTTFPLRAFREVKRRLPRGFPVGFRLLLREWVPDGIDPAEATVFAGILETEGVGYLSPSVATYNSMFLPQVRKEMSRPGYLMEDTAALSQTVKVPTVLSGRVLTPRFAEKLLLQGVAPLIGLGRALRIDMDWVRKARTGEKVNVCVNCNRCLKRVILDRGFNCARWPEWVRERIDLEQRLLTRGMFRGLWVVAGPGDGKMVKAVMPHMVPARHGISTDILFLNTADSPSVPETLRKEIVDWSTQMWRGRGFTGGDLRHLSMQTDGPLEDALGKEVEKGAYGAILLGRDPREPWRERFLYKQKGKVVGLFSPNPRWAKVMVPVDLSLASLLVMRLLSHSLLQNPAFTLDFVHVLQGKDAEALKRWEDMRKILGWDERHALRFLPSQQPVGEVLLREIHQGRYGTVIMGKRGISRIKRMLLGSVSAAVLHHLTDQSIVLID